MINPENPPFYMNGKTYFESEYCRRHVCWPDENLENLTGVPQWRFLDDKLEPCLRTTCGCKFDFPKK